MIVQDSARKEWKDWLQKYVERVVVEKEAWVEPKSTTNGVNDNGEVKSESGWEDHRTREMRSKNPRFVLRQWVLEEVIRKVEEDSKEGKKVLAKIMHVRDLFSYHLDLLRDANHTDFSLWPRTDGMQPVRTLGR